MASRRQSDRYARRTNVREQVPVFLIVCEGEKTEPSYFRAFPVSTSPKVVVLGTGFNTVSLVREAERQRGQYDDTDQVWCVFDKDSFSAADFNGAIEAARTRGFGVAYTNEAFELWYLLHFAHHTSALSRTQYGDKLSGRLGHEYAKNSATMYEELRDRQPDAIANADRLLSGYSVHNPAVDNPCTTVQDLVRELMRFCR